MTIEQVLEDMQTWTPDERRRLRAALDEAPAHQMENALDDLLSEPETLRRQDLLEQRLRAAGLLEEMARPENGEARPVEPEAFPLVTVAGEPVSETIIRERR